MKEYKELIKSNKSFQNELIRNIEIGCLLVMYIENTDENGAFENFTIKSATDKFNNILKQFPERMNTESRKKNGGVRDLSREIRDNVENRPKMNIGNNKWYRQEKDSAYSLTPIGIKFAEEKIVLIVEELKETKFSEELVFTNGNGFTIKEIVDNIKSGINAKIPTFQREYVWRREKIAPLIFSLVRNYPIGTLLFWDQNGDEKYVILDGLQRTFSLTKLYDHPYAYINFELYEWFVTKKLRHQKTSLSENEFESQNKKWANCKKEDMSIDEMLKHFNYDNQINKLINYIVAKWNLIHNELKIPVIVMGKSFDRDDTADVFNLINSQGIELNNYEKASSIWSKTPIILDRELEEKHFIIKWRKEKELKYRSEIGVKENINEEKDFKEIEPSNFIYSIFQESCKNARGKKLNIINDSFFNGDRIKQTALEPVLTIFMNILGIDYSKKDSINEIGKKLSESINTEKDIENIKNTIWKANGVVAKSLLLLNNIVTNSDDGITIKLATSILSLLINIAIKHRNDKNVINNLFNIFIVEYFGGKYSTGSTSFAWKQFKSGDYLDYSSSRAESEILKYIDNKHKQDKVEKIFDDKLALITSLFRSRFILGASKDSYQVDHIIPKSLFKLDAKKNRIQKNYVNTFYNLQLLPANVNKEKANKINVNESSYYLAYELDKYFIPQSKNSTYLNLFKKKVNLVRNDLCKQSKIEFDKKCSRITKNSEGAFENFIDLMNFNEKNIRSLIECNGLLNDNKIKTIKLIKK